MILLIRFLHLPKTGRSLNERDDIWESARRHAAALRSVMRSVQRLAMAALTGLAILAAGLSPAAAEDDVEDSLADQAPYALLLNADTNTVLFRRAPDTPFPPASLAKLMTMAVVFDALKAGEVTLDTEYKVSTHAWRTGGAPAGGSTMFAELNSVIRLEDLIRGVIVQSGNDAAIVIAEGMAGSEAAFAARMNKRARELGLSNSHFTNPSGLHDPDMKVTVRDLAKIARYLIRVHPNYYRYYGEKEFTWNKILQRNRNPLLKRNIGADGLKTGYVKESGYGLVGSAVRDGQRLIVVVGGAARPRDRERAAVELLEWGHSAFRQVRLFDEGVAAGAARVFGGDKRYVKLIGDGPVAAIVPRETKDRIRGAIHYIGPIEAPIEPGRPLAIMKVTREGEVIQETLLYSGEAIGVGNLHQRAFDAALELLFGWW